MNKIFLTLILVISLAAGNAFAQAVSKLSLMTFTPTVNWPYLNPDFEKGIVHLKSGVESEAALLNVHLAGNVLQCVDAHGVINNVIFSNVDYVEIGDGKYRYVDGQMARVLYEGRDCQLFYVVKADFDEMSRNRTPYRLSGRTSMTMVIRNLGLKGVSNERYEDIRPVWKEGWEIPLLETFMFTVKGRHFPATQKGCLNAITPDQRKAFKAFVKSNGIKWKDVSDLKRVLDYMKENAVLK